MSTFNQISVYSRRSAPTFRSKEAIIRMDKGIFLLKHGDVKRGKSIEKYQNYQPLSDEQKHFVNEHLGRLLMRKSQFEEAEQLFRLLPEFVQHRTAMIADSLLCQAESLSGGDDVSKVCKDKLAKMQADPRHTVFTCSIGMRLHLLNECASLGCKDSVHEALLLLEDIRKQSDRDNMLQVNADRLFLHSTCVYEFCARLLQLKDKGFHVERRRTTVECGNEPVANMLQKVEKMLCTDIYPRSYRLSMTEQSLRFQSVEELINHSPSSIWHTLEESRKVLDAVWNELVSEAHEELTRNHIPNYSKAINYYPFAYKKLNSSDNKQLKVEDITQAMRMNWPEKLKTVIKKLIEELQQASVSPSTDVKGAVDSKRQKKIDQKKRNFFESRKDILSRLDKAEAIWKFSDEEQEQVKELKKKFDELDKQTNLDDLIGKLMTDSLRKLNGMLSAPFPVSFQPDKSLICKWMIEREETMLKNQGGWHKIWCTEINHDKHNAQKSIVDIDKKIKDNHGKQKDKAGPADVVQMAHFAAEFAEEARLVLRNYSYKEVSGFPMKFEALKSDYDWKWACYKCATGFDALRSRFKEPSEQCTDCEQVILLVRDKKAVSGSKWQRIRPRRRKLIKLEMCFKYSDIPDCNECMRAHCDSAALNTGCGWRGG
uniref:TPR_REGION domain-containing protein n=1 Tax=Macrostomum lignano TaxID=282301 RepID=A0A1I8HQA1_9PLAT